MEMREFLNIMKKNKVLLVVIATYLIILISPLLSFSNNVRILENNVTWLDLSRSSIIFIFDSLLLLFLIIVPFGTLLLLAMRRRIKVIKKLMVIILIIIVISSSIIPSGTPLHSEQTRAKPLAKKVFIITFDGTRADTFWKHANWIIEHRDMGSWAKKFVVTYPTVTYPNHVSLVTGTWPQVHGTESNVRKYRSIQFMLRVYREPRVEDIFDVAERYDILTAVFTPAATLASIIGGEKTRRITNVGYGQETMQAAINYISNNKAEIDDRGVLIWIHLVDPDETLHQYGVDSIQYRSAIRAMADQVGLLYESINSLGWENDTVIIVTADHGAIGNRHYGVWPPLVVDVPFWIWGRPIRKGFELGGGRIIDIAPTVAFILGIPAPSRATGIVLYDVFDEDYVRSIRGENIILGELAYRALIKAFWDEVIEIYFWGLISLSMAWIIIIEIKYLLNTLRELAREEKKLKKKK